MKTLRKVCSVLLLLAATLFWVPTGSFAQWTGQVQQSQNFTATGSSFGLATGNATNYPNIGLYKLDWVPYGGGAVSACTINVQAASTQGGSYSTISPGTNTCTGAGSSTFFVTPASTNAFVDINIATFTGYSQNIGVTQGSTAITASANFTTGTSWNNVPIIIGGVTYTIASVTNSSAAVLTTAYLGATSASVAATLGSVTVTLTGFNNTPLPTTGMGCGTTTTSATETCATQTTGTAQKVYVGLSVLAGSTQVVTFPVAFSSVTSYACVANDITTRANVVQMVQTSTTTATITNTTGATDSINWICAGN